MAGETLERIALEPSDPGPDRRAVGEPLLQPQIETVVRWLLLALMFNIPFENVVILPGFGTTVRLMGVVLAGSWIGLKLWSRSWRRPHNFHWLVYSFVCWVSVTSLWSPNGLGSITLVVTAIQLGLVTMIVWDLTRTRKQLEQLMQAFVLGCLVVVGILGIRYLNGQITQFEKRATIPNSNENDIGLTLAISLPISWRLATRNRLPDIRPSLLTLLNFAAVPLAILGIFLTASRASLVSAVFVAPPVLVSILHQRPLKRFGLLGALVAGIGAMSLVIPPATITRVLTIGEQVENRDIGDRFVRWGWAIDLWTSDPSTLLFGSGSLGYQTETETVAHSTALGLLADFGLVGFLLFAALFGSLFWKAMRTGLQDRMCWGGVLVAWSIGTMSLTWEFAKLTWLLVGIVLVVVSTPRSEPSQ